MGIIEPIVVGTSVVRLVAADPARTSVGFANTHTTAILYIGDSPEVTADNGFPIDPKTVTYFNTGLGDRPDAAWYGISDTATTPIRIIVQWRKQDGI